MERWLRQWSQPLGAVLSLDQGWKLAKGWYHDRLQPDWKPKAAPEIRRLFNHIGLTGPFWELP